MARARALGREKLARTFDTTGKSMVWNPEFQREAMELHAHGKLFSGTRQEDEHYGQETEPDDLEVDGVALPDARLRSMTAVTRSRGPGCEPQAHFSPLRRSFRRSKKPCGSG